MNLLLLLARIPEVWIHQALLHAKPCRLCCLGCEDEADLQSLLPAQQTAHSSGWCMGLVVEQGLMNPYLWYSGQEQQKTLEIRLVLASQTTQPARLGIIRDIVHL
jgi:hypothetical protein